MTKAILIGQSSYCRKMHPSIVRHITERDNFFDLDRREAVFFYSRIT